MLPGGGQGPGPPEASADDPPRAPIRAEAGTYRRPDWNRVRGTVEPVAATRELIRGQPPFWRGYRSPYGSRYGLGGGARHPGGARGAPPIDVGGGDAAYSSRFYGNAVDDYRETARNERDTGYWRTPQYRRSGRAGPGRGRGPHGRSRSPIRPQSPNRQRSRSRSRSRDRWPPGPAVMDRDYARAREPYDFAPPSTGHVVELQYLQSGTGLTLGLQRDETASNAGSVSETASLVRMRLGLTSDRSEAQSQDQASVTSGPKTETSEAAPQTTFAPPPERRRLQASFPPVVESPAGHDADVESASNVSEPSESSGTFRGMRRRAESGSERGGYDTPSDASSIHRESQYYSDVTNPALSDQCGDGPYQSDIASTVASTDVQPPESVASMRTPPSSPGAQSFASSGL